MKRQLFLFALIAALFTLNACKSDQECPDPDPSMMTFSSAKEYSDHIVANQMRVSNTILDLSAAFASGDSMVMVNARNHIIDEVDRVMKDMENVPPFKCNSDLRDASKELFLFNKSLAENEYKEIVALMVVGENISENDLDRMDEIVNDITIRENEIGDRFDAAQKAFATKHELKIVDNVLNNTNENRERTR